MKFILPVLLLLSRISFAQVPSEPLWASSYIGFETAKYRQFDDKTKKYGPDKYKTCTVVISNGNDIPLQDVTIDLPDLFYIKSSDISYTEYKKEEDKSMTISYVVKTDIKYAYLSIHYAPLEEHPDFINVTVTENINVKPLKTTTYMLTVFK